MPIDPCGLALGVVGLAGLFTTCVECFDYVHASRRYGRDCEILITKLEVEKTRFLMWGDMIGILKPKEYGRDPVIDHPWTGPIIERILGSIKAIFHDTEKIRSRYGLKSLPYASVERRSPAGLSSNLMKKFQESYTKFLSRSVHLQRESTTVDKIRWAIHHRSKFQVLLRDLKDLIDGLTSITPSATCAEDRTTRMILQEQINSLSDSTSLRLLQEACAESYPDLSEMASVRIESPGFRGNHVELGDSVSTPDVGFDVNIATAGPEAIGVRHEYRPVPSPHIVNDYPDISHLVHVEYARLKRRNTDLQNEIASSRALIAKIQTVPLAMQLDAQSVSGSYDMPYLEIEVDSWASGILRAPPVPLDEICDSIFVDLSTRRTQSTPWRARSLLRSAMMEVVSEVLLKNVVFTNVPQVDSELTNIYERILSKNSTAAAFWLRSTLSVTQCDHIPSPREILKDRFPTLTKLLSPIDDTRILGTALAISRRLRNLSISSRTFHRSFTPLLGSRLDFAEADLTQMCLRKETGLACKVGAVICMGLVKVQRRPVYPEGTMGNDTTIIRKAKIICHCALVPQASILSEKSRRDVVESPPVLDYTLPAWQPRATAPQPRFSRPRDSPITISLISTPRSPWPSTSSSIPAPETKRIPPRPLSPDPPPPFSMDYKNLKEAETSFAGRSVRQLPSIPQSASPSLHASSRFSQFYLPNEPVLSSPHHQQSSPRIVLDTYDRTPQLPDDIRDGSPDVSTVTMEVLIRAVFRLMTEVTTLRAQVQALQPLSPSDNASDISQAEPEAASAMGCDGPPPYLSFY